MLPATVKKYLRNWIWRRLALKYSLPSGVKIEVKSIGDWYIYNEIFVGGEYDLAIQRLIQGGAEPGAAPGTVLDLGANVGFFFLRWLHLWRAAGSPGKPPRFFLVEGSSRTCKDLQSRLTGQPLAGVEVSVMNNLVGQRTGVGTITDSLNHFGNRVTKAAHGGVNVPFVDIVELCRDAPTVGLMKCDIEGSEELFLKSNAELLQKTQCVAIELHHKDCDTAQCGRYLESAGLVHSESLREAGEFSVRYFWR